MDVAVKGESVAARAVITTQDGSIHLLRNNEHTWTREESLARLVPRHTLFLDLPVPEPKVQLNVSTGNLLSAYITRVTTHIKQLKDLPTGLTAFARHFATGKYEEIDLESTNRDAFGLRKFILVVTKQGSLIALDSANKGNIVWRLGLAGEVLGTWILRESSAVRGQPPVVGVLVSSAGGVEFVLVNGLDGVEYEREPANLEVPNIVKMFQVPAGMVDAFGRRPVIVVPRKGGAKILPASTEATSLLSQLSDKVYYSVQEDNAIQGYFFNTQVPPFSNQISPLGFVRHSDMALPSPSRHSPRLPLLPLSLRKSRLNRPRPGRPFCSLQIFEPSPLSSCRHRFQTLAIHTLHDRQCLRSDTP